MAVTVQHPQPTTSRYARIPAWLRELDFVTDGFTWLFRLMSRGAEALMTLSTIYIIIEAGVPVIAITWLHNLAVAIMIAAPEIILPGGFILAGEIHAQGNRRSWMLYGMCWIFVVLTGATLADLFIWHFTGGAFAAIMWARCAAAVGYSILFRVITHRRETEVMPVADVQTLIEQKVTEMAQRIAESEQQTQGVYTSTRREIETRIEHQLGMISHQFQGEMQAISAQLSTLISALESLQKQETLSPETDADYSEESSEEDEREPATEAGATGGQSRKYYMTFAEVSAQTGLSILQLKRRANTGAIEVNAAGKIRVKSLRNLRPNPPTKSRVVQSKPALSLVKKEVVNE